MKRAVVSGLTAVLLAVAFAPIAQADSVNEVDTSFPSTASDVGMEVTPFNLVFLAYQGFFESEGVPMASGLIDGYQSGSVTSQDLVQVAISMNRLGADKLSDSRYLSAVDYQLEALLRND